MQRENFALTDGRNIEFLRNSVIDNSAIILHAGTAQDISGWRTWLDYFASRGVSALAFGRSGYGGSSRKPGRVTIDVANDVAQLVSKLEIREFVNLGLSGGGQHAIATGLKKGSKGVVTVGSLAPFESLKTTFYDGMQQADIDEYHDALVNINLLIARFKRSFEQDPRDYVAGVNLSENDLKASASPTWECIMKSLHYTMTQGWDWVADDYSSYLNPWGFDPRSLSVPAVIWQGGLDKNVPPQHGQWLVENLEFAHLELRPDESHLGVFVNYEVPIMESAINLLN